MLKWQGNISTEMELNHSKTSDNILNRPRGDPKKPKLDENLANQDDEKQLAEMLKLLKERELEMDMKFPERKKIQVFRTIFTLMIQE